MTDIGYYTLPVLVSMRGIDAQVNEKLRKQFRDVGKLAGGDFGKALSPEIAGHGGKAGLKFTQEFRTTAERAGAGVGLVIGKTIGAGISTSLAGAALDRNAFDLISSNGRSAGSNAGRLMGAAMGTAMTGALALAAVPAAAVVAGIGYTLTKGFQRLESIDAAKFKLKALGHDAGEVKTIMDNALKSVKGTSFSLDEAATSAASAVAAGIKPGEQLTKYLKEIADTAAIAGTNFGEMAHIFNKVQTQNKAYTDDLQMLSDRGVPIFQWLQEEYRVTGAELQKMVEKGEVDAAHFQAAIDKHIGGAALTMGQSFDGSVKNVEAAIGRLGAAFLAPVFGNAAGGLGSITGELDNLTAWIDQHQPAIIDFWTMIGTAAIRGLQNVARGAGGILQAIGDIAGGIGNIEGTILKFESWQASVRGDTATADELHRQSEEAYGWGESIRAMGDKLANLNLDTWAVSVRNWGDAAKHAATEARGASGEVAALGTAIGALPSNKGIEIHADLEQAKSDVKAFIDSLAAGPGVKIPIAAAPPGYNPLLPAGPATPPHGGGRASGGSIFGPGTGTSDSVPIMASHGEHMWTASEVNAVGGQANMYRLRSLARKGAFRHFSGGGPMDFWKLGSSGGGGDFKGPGVGDIGKRIDSPLKPQNPIWGDRRKGIIQGPNYSPRGPVDDIGVIAPWWMFPGGPTNQRGGIYGMNPDSPDWDRRREIFGGPTADDKLPPGAYAPGARAPRLMPKPQPGAAWWDPVLEHSLGYKDGGEITSDWYSSVVGSPYAMGGFGNSFDCSGAVSAGVNVAMGRQWNQGPPGGSPRMATGSEAEWLASQGFVMGVGPPGSIRVGWVNGGPGGGHTAMTLADGTNFESSSGKGVALGGGARGASDPMFTQHAYLPAGPQMPGSKGSPGSAATGGGGSGSSSGKSGGGGGGLSGSLSDLAGGAVKIGVDGLLETIGADGSWLPDIQNMGIMKTLSAALGIKVHTKDGTYSVMGFQPNDTTGGTGGGGTSLSPFGMQTTMPQVGSAASGVGTGPAPGPVDQSTNITVNNPLGEPTEKSIKQFDKTRPRIDSHMPAGF